MNGGFFLAPALWAGRLPEGMTPLASVEEAGRRSWELLVLTHAGCRLLAGRPLRARVVLLPGECPAGGVLAETVVTYGLSPRDSITLSSLTEPVLCLQRTVPMAGGGVLEPQEMPLPGAANAQDLLPWLAARLLWTGRV